MHVRLEVLYEHRLLEVAGVGCDFFRPEVGRSEVRIFDVDGSGWERQHGQHVGAVDVDHSVGRVGDRTFVVGNEILGNPTLGELQNEPIEPVLAGHADCDKLAGRGTTAGALLVGCVSGKRFCSGTGWCGTGWRSARRAGTCRGGPIAGRDIAGRDIAGRRRGFVGIAARGHDDSDCGKSAEPDKPTGRHAARTRVDNGTFR
jgi:hypothetical protein